jgi:hypothetical protein
MLQIVIVIFSIYVGFEARTALIVKIIVFWIITLLFGEISKFWGNTSLPSSE